MMWRDADADGVAVLVRGRRAAKIRPTRARPETCWDEVLTTPVEVAAPDRESARALLDETMPHFNAELVETNGATTFVRLRPASTAPVGWVFELLALVERWLEAHNLQVANVHHGRRSYVIQAASPRSDGPDPVAAESPLPMAVSQHLRVVFAND
jgi:hypothetical protein